MFKYIQEVLQTLWKEASRNKGKLKKSKGSRFDVTKGKTSIKPEILAPQICNEKHDIENSKEIVKLKKTYEMLMKKFVNPRLQIIAPSLRNLEHMTLLGNMKTQNTIRSSITDVLKNIDKKNEDKLKSLPGNSVVLKEVSLGWSGQLTDKYFLSPKIETSSCPHDIASAFFAFPELEELSKNKKVKQSKKKYKRKKYGKLNKRQNIPHNTFETPGQLITKIPKSLISKYYNANFKQDKAIEPKRIQVPENHYCFPSTSMDKQNEEEKEHLNSDILQNSNNFKMSTENLLITNIEENIQPIQQLSSDSMEDASSKYAPDKTAILANERNIGHKFSTTKNEANSQSFPDERRSIATCSSNKLLKNDTSSIIEQTNTIVNELQFENREIKRKDFSNTEESERFKPVHIDPATCLDGEITLAEVQNQCNERESSKIHGVKSNLINVTNTESRSEEIKNKSTAKTNIYPDNRELEKTNSNSVKGKKNILQHGSLINSAERKKTNEYPKNKRNLITKKINKSKGTVGMSNKENSGLNKSHKSPINTSLNPNEMKDAPEKELGLKIQSNDYKNSTIKEVLQPVSGQSLNTNVIKINSSIKQNVNPKDTKRDSIIENKQNIKLEHSKQGIHNTYSKIKSRKSKHSLSPHRKQAVNLRQNSYTDSNVNSSVSNEFTDYNSIINSKSYSLQLGNHIDVNKDKKMPDLHKRNKNAYWILLSNKACIKKDVQGDIYNSTKTALKPQIKPSVLCSNNIATNDCESNDSPILGAIGLSQNKVKPSKIVKQENRFLQDNIIEKSLPFKNSLSNSKLSNKNQMRSKENLKASMNLPKLKKMSSTVIAKSIQTTNNKQRKPQNLTQNSTTKNTHRKDDLLSSITFRHSTNTIPLRDNLDNHTNNTKDGKTQNMTLIKPTRAAIQEEEEVQQSKLLPTNRKTKPPSKSNRSESICKRDYIKFVKNKAWYFGHSLNKKVKIPSLYNTKYEKQGKLLFIPNKDEGVKKEDGNTNSNITLTRPRLAKQLKTNKNSVQIKNIIEQFKKRAKEKNFVTKAQKISLATIKKRNNKYLFKHTNENEKVPGLVRKTSTPNDPEMSIDHVTHKCSDVKDQNIKLISSLNSTPISHVYSSMFSERLKLIPNRRKSELSCHEKLKTSSEASNAKLSLNFTQNRCKSISKENNNVSKEINLLNKKNASYTLRKNMNTNNFPSSNEKKMDLKCFVPDKVRKLHSKKIETKKCRLKMYGVGKPTESDALPNVHSLKSVQVLCKKRESTNSMQKTQSLKLPFKKSPFQSNKRSLINTNNITFANNLPTRNIFTIENNTNMIMNFLFRRYASTITNQYKLNKSRIVMNSNNNFCQPDTVDNISKILVKEPGTANGVKETEYMNKMKSVHHGNYRSDTQINSHSVNLVRKNVKLSKSIVPSKDVTSIKENMKLGNGSNGVSTNLEPQNKTDQVTLPLCNPIPKKKDHNIVVLYSRNKTKDKPIFENLSLKNESNSTFNLKQSPQSHLLSTPQNTLDTPINGYIKPSETVIKDIKNKSFAKKNSNHETSCESYLKTSEMSNKNIKKVFSNIQVPVNIHHKSENQIDNTSIITEKCLSLKSLESNNKLSDGKLDKNDNTINMLLPVKGLQKADSKMPVQNLFNSRSTLGGFKLPRSNFKEEDQQNIQKWKSKTDRLNNWATRKKLYCVEFQPKRRTHIKTPISFSKTNIEDNKSEVTTNKICNTNITNEQSIRNIAPKNVQGNNNRIVSSKLKKPLDPTDSKEIKCNFTQGNEFKVSQVKQCSQASPHEKSNPNQEAKSSKTSLTKDLAPNASFVHILRQTNAPINNHAPLEQDNSDSFQYQRRRCKLQNNKCSQSGKEYSEVKNNILDNNKNIMKPTTSNNDLHTFPGTKLIKSSVNDPLLLKLKNNYQSKKNEMGTQLKTDETSSKIKLSIDKNLSPPLGKNVNNKGSYSIIAKQSENTVKMSHLFEDVVDSNLLESQAKNVNFKKDKDISNIKPTKSITAEKSIKQPSVKDILSTFSMKNNCKSKSFLPCNGEENSGSLQPSAGDVNFQRKNQPQPSQSVLAVNANIYKNIDNARPSTAQIFLPEPLINNSKISKASTIQIKNVEKNDTKSNQSSFKDPNFHEVKRPVKNVMLNITGSSNNKKILAKRVDTKPIFLKSNHSSRKFTKKVIRNLSNLYKRKSEISGKVLSSSSIFHNSPDGDSKERKTTAAAKNVERIKCKNDNGKTIKHNVNNSNNIIKSEPKIQNKGVNKPLKINFTCTEDYKSPVKKIVPKSVLHNNVTTGNECLNKDIGLGINKSSMQLTKNAQVISPENKETNLTNALLQKKSVTNMSDILNSKHSDEAKSLNSKKTCLMTPGEIKQMEGKINTSILKMANKNDNKCNTVTKTKPNKTTFQNEEEKKSSEPILTRQVEIEKYILKRPSNIDTVIQNIDKNLNSQSILSKSFLITNSNNDTQNIKPSEEKHIKINKLQSWRPRRSITLIKRFQ